MKQTVHALCELSVYPIPHGSAHHLTHRRSALLCIGSLNRKEGRRLTSSLRTRFGGYIHTVNATRPHTPRHHQGESKDEFHLSLKKMHYYHSALYSRLKQDAWRCMKVHMCECHLSDLPRIRSERGSHCETAQGVASPLRLHVPFNSRFPACSNRFPPDEGINSKASVILWEIIRLFTFCWRCDVMLHGRMQIIAYKQTSRRCLVLRAIRFR